jgi:adenine-specific DNA-methyltransferase
LPKKELTKEELHQEVSRLKKELRNKKRYGLVWEEKVEDVVEVCKEKLPVLEEVKNKEIISDNKLPVNILIEGDNYHALSVLNYTHESKVDVIYIDPPYNTGAKNWTYNNHYVDKEDSYKHSKYISFIYHRLKLSKKLLRSSGIIICAIDDYEIHNVRHLMDDIFGENNRLGTIVVIHNPRGRNDDKFLATMHEYMLVYAKNADRAKINDFNLTEEKIEKYNQKDDISFYNETSFIRTGNNSLREERPNLYYPIYLNTKDNSLHLAKGENFIKLLPINGKGEHRTWRWGKETFLAKKDTELFIKKVKGNYKIYKKRRLTDITGTKPKTVWTDSKYDSSSNGIMLLQNMFENSNPFSYPKSLYAVKDILEITTGKDSTIIDFFAGSGTTGQAVLELNKDGGNRKFILCTNNENRIATDVCYPRLKKVINGYTSNKKVKTTGLGGNLKYYKTEFVEGLPTDKNKKILTEKATEMLCLKENTFILEKENKEYKIFSNQKKFTGIIYNHDAIESFKKDIRSLNGKFKVYIFSLGDDTFDEEFNDLKEKVKLSPIPEAILRVYRRIFK